MASSCTRPSQDNITFQTAPLRGLPSVRPHKVQCLWTNVIETSPPLRGSSSPYAAAIACNVERYSRSSVGSIVVIIVAIRVFDYGDRFFFKYIIVPVCRKLAIDEKTRTLNLRTNWWRDFFFFLSTCNSRVRFLNGTPYWSRRRRSCLIQYDRTKKKKYIYWQNDRVRSYYSRVLCFVELDGTRTFSDSRRCCSTDSERRGMLLV